VGEERLNKFQVWSRDSARAAQEIDLHTKNLVSIVQRQANDLQALQSMYGTLVLVAREMGMEEIPLATPDEAHGLEDLRSKVAVAVTLFDRWDDLGEREIEAILDILYPDRHLKAKIEPPK
jgi:hypothetical protein